MAHASFEVAKPYPFGGLPHSVSAPYEGNTRRAAHNAAPPSRYGEGVLKKGVAPVNYYNSFSASWGP